MQGSRTSKGRETTFAGRLFRRALSLVGAVALTVVFFLVLPLIQAISKPPRPDLLVLTVDAAALPPPPPPLDEEPEPEKEEEPPPPELAEDPQPLELSQLELALNPGFGGDWLGGADLSVNLSAVVGGEDADALFSLADLDEKPRAIYQPQPIVDARVRKKAPGTATIIFIVDERGHVDEPLVQAADDPVFERPALDAVKKWKFEPGKRNGRAVSFRMRVDVTFPKDG